MFAQATLNEIQRTGDTITLSSLPSQVGWVYPASEKSKRRGARRESTSRDRLHVCGQANRLALHLRLRQAGYYLLVCFFPPFFLPFHALASHVMHPGQDAHPAARAGGRQGSLHIFANCKQSVKRIWNEDDGTGLQRKSKQPRPEPKCFKWITPVCHCDYTLLAGTATRWIVFYGFTADLFSFFSPPSWMHPPRPLLYCVAWSECGIVFAFELPHKQFICYFSLRGHFLFISEWIGWLRNHVYVYIFMLWKWYFRLPLACFVQLKHWTSQ